MHISVHLEYVDWRLDLIWAVLWDVNTNSVSCEIYHCQQQNQHLNVLMRGQLRKTQHLYSTYVKRSSIRKTHYKALSILSQKRETVAEKCDCRRKRRDNGEIR